MQSSDAMEVVAPLAGGISEVSLFPDAAVVLVGTAGALVEPGRSFHTALPHDGEVAISAKNSVPRPGASTGVVEIIVADNGSGMTDEVLRRAFDSNFTISTVGQGSGLGLGQVQQFVQQSGGAVEIKSAVGIGTAVRVMLLPASRPADGNSVDLSNSIATF